MIRRDPRLEKQVAEAWQKRDPRYRFMSLADLIVAYSNTIKWAMMRLQIAAKNLRQRIKD